MRLWCFLALTTCVSAIGCGDSGTGGAGGTTSASTTGSSATSTNASTGSGTMACQADCETTHAAGFALLSQIVVESCGCSMGTTPPAPCKTQCTAEACCTDNMPNIGTPTKGGACETCILAEGAKGIGSQCAAVAAVSMMCSNDADCKALVMCEQACLGG